MHRASKVEGTGILIGIAVLFALALFSSVEDLAAWIVALLCGGLSVLLLSLVRDRALRRRLIQIFCVAYVVRLVFALFAYKSGLADMLGGGDDQAWRGAWEHSRYWRGWLGNGQPLPVLRERITTPETFIGIYDGTAIQNSAYRFFASWFYYLLDVRSQMALAFVNCALNALTVVVIYCAARDFFDEKAANFAAMAATLLPGFLVWSALTIKEPALIFCEITAFYLIWRFSRNGNVLALVATLLLIILVQGLRFYVAWVLVAASCLSLVCFRSKNLRRTAVGTLVLLVFVGIIVNNLGLVHFDAASIMSSRMDEMSTYRSNLSDVSQAGTRSSVRLDYDIRTPAGGAMMLLTGASYLLLSPFPWQVDSLRQAATLPDVMAWWFLFFGYILPGIRYAWRRQALTLALMAYTLPLIMFYSLIFGNVGLAYRQRAQLMPFLLIFAAAGHYSRRIQRKNQIVPVEAPVEIASPTPRNAVPALRHR